MESGTSLTLPQGIELRNKDNPLVFMDLSNDGTAAVRLVIELFKDEMPIAAENFRALCTGEKGTGITTGKPLHYKGTVFYRMHKRIFAEGGDIENNDGTGGESIYGGTFKAESDEHIRSKRGMVYMVHDAQMIDSKFIIVFQQHFFISWDYVVVGRILERMESLEKIEQFATDTGKPSGLVKVTDCGEFSQDNMIRA